MASLQNVKPKTPTLNKVANIIKNKVVALAPKKTGNLKNQLNNFNRPVGIVKQTISNKKIQLSFQIDVSPPGAEYGKWWNDPTVSSTVKNGQTPNVPRSINFAQKAFNDPEVKNAIDMLVNDVYNDLVEFVGTNIRKL
jgi:hypothetical protein